jgi:hypothetical protein
VTREPKKYHGYSFSRLCVGVLNIQRRAASRAESLDDCGAAANLIEWEREHTRCYLWTFRVSIDEFTEELTKRTSHTYAQRFFDGFLAARIDERECA